MNFDVHGMFLCDFNDNGLSFWSRILFGVHFQGVLCLFGRLRLFSYSFVIYFGVYASIGGFVEVSLGPYILQFESYYVNSFKGYVFVH